MDSKRSSLDGEVLAQAKVRVMICAFMGGYFAWFGLPNHPVYLLFVAYSIFMLVFASLRTSIRRPTTVVSLLIDNGFSICGLHVTGERGTFLLIFLIHISFAYGVRFGRGYLIASLVISCSGVSWLYFSSVPWQGRIHFLLSFLFGMPFISLYVYALTGKLRASESLARASHARANQLLTFMTHDIRAPLHLLLEAVIRLRREARSQKQRASLERMEQIIAFMGRMVASVLDTQRNVGAPKDAEFSDTAKIQHISTTHWLVSFCEMFRDSTDAKGASLRYTLDSEFDHQTCCEISALERVMVNVLSNALRHCENGHIIVTTRLTEKTAGIAVENAVGTNVESSAATFSTEDRKRDFFYGSGTGLLAATEAAKIAGASFRFYQGDSGTYCSELDIKRCPSNIPAHAPISVPIVFVSRTSQEWRDGISSLGEIAGVYWKSDIGVTLEGEAKEFRESDTIYVYTDDPDERALNSDKFPVRKGARFVQCTSNPELSPNLLFVDERRILLSTSATKSTWCAAVRIAEIFYDTVKKSEEVQNSNKLALLNVKVLALDDNPSNLALLQIGLRSFGIDIDPVSSVVEATLALRSVKYDVLILDWNIGISTADEFLRSLGCRDSETPFSILLLTGEMVTESMLQLATNCKIVGLSKPVSNETVFLTLCNLLGTGSPYPPDHCEHPRELVFSSRIYLEMDLTEDSIALVENALDGFLLDVRRALFNWPEIFSGVRTAEIELELHKLASMCYSAGAYALGDGFKTLRTLRFDEVSRDSLAIVHRISALQEIYVLTRSHIRWLFLTFQAIRESAN